MSDCNSIGLIWEDPNTRSKMIVGELKKQDGYTFNYTGEYETARDLGWEMLRPFPEVRVYHSKRLFPVFASRLPDRRRRDIKNILAEYGMKEYDAYELLKRSGARLPIDTYEFAEIILVDDKEIDNRFYISGMRYNAKCQGKDCHCLSDINEGDELILKRVYNNDFDKYATGIYRKNGEMLGYVPAYYTQAITHKMEIGMKYNCQIDRFNCNGKCGECVRVRLKMTR